jgi:hypothetical protein
MHSIENDVLLQNTFLAIHKQLKVEKELLSSAKPMKETVDIGA